MQKFKWPCPRWIFVFFIPQIWYCSNKTKKLLVIVTWWSNMKTATKFNINNSLRIFYSYSCDFRKVFKCFCIVIIIIRLFSPFFSFADLTFTKLTWTEEEIMQFVHVKTHWLIELRFASCFIVTRQIANLNDPVAFDLRQNRVSYWFNLLFSPILAELIQNLSSYFAASSY